LDTPSYTEKSEQLTQICSVIYRSDLIAVST